MLPAGPGGDDMSGPIEARLLRVGPPWDQPDADPVGDCLAFGELGRAYVEDLTGAAFEDALADAMWLTMQNGGVSIGGVTYEVNVEWTPHLWALLAPESMVEHLVEWVDEYKVDRRWT